MMLAIDPPGYNDIPGFHTVQYIEIIWTVIAMWGMTFSILNLRNARRDREDLKAAGEDPVLDLFTRGTLTTETLRLTKEVALLAVGIASMLVVPVQPPPNRVQALSIAFVLLLFYFSFMTSLTAQYVWLLRRRLERVKHDGV